MRAVANAANCRFGSMVALVARCQSKPLTKQGRGTPTASATSIRLQTEMSPGDRKSPRMAGFVVCTGVSVATNFGKRVISGRRSQAAKFRFLGNEDRAAGDSVRMPKFWWGKAEHAVLA